MDGSNGVALVTGAGRGLGRVISLALAAAGWDVALMARSEDELGRVAEEIRACGRDAWVLQGSVGSESDVGSAFETLDLAAGRLDVLVNCAGAGSFAAVAESCPEDWRRMLDTNLTGTYLCCRQAVRRMKQQGRGDILNILSIGARVVFPGASGYCASKWGALALTKVLSDEVRREGIRVTAVCPGSIDTPFWDAQSLSLDRRDMLRAADVANAVVALLAQPRSVYTDEIVLMPPKGIL